MTPQNHLLFSAATSSSQFTAPSATNHDSEPFVSNTDECVLLRILPGKPNRKAAFPKRVAQSAQKGPTCFYYALKIDAILDENYLKRQNESDRKAASKYRKKYLP